SPLLLRKYCRISGRPSLSPVEELHDISETPVNSFLLAKPSSLTKIFRWIS
ncbi:hypothetical protein HAX54_020081, partial [Datura stramonium]|nr:hypothetical protein [Datura stramonium]